MRKLSKYFYDLDSPFELKIFQVAAFGGMLAAFAGSFTSWYSKLPFLVVFVTAHLCQVITLCIEKQRFDKIVRAFERCRLAGS